jgi:hypothetical protein
VAELVNPFRVRFRLHATGPDGRLGMVVNVEVPVLFAGIPVGAIVAFAKSLAGCPVLPDNFEECDGHTCVNALSPFVGVVIPNLNGAAAGAQRFLRGSVSASGAIGGEDAHVLSVAELASHSHTIVENTGVGTTPGIKPQNIAATTVSTGSQGSSVAHENRPPFYEVVWVMRIF